MSVNMEELLAVQTWHVAFCVAKETIISGILLSCKVSESQLGSDDIRVRTDIISVDQNAFLR